MLRTEIKSLFENVPEAGTAVTVCGWAKTIRDSKSIGFIELSDGSCFKSLQIVFEETRLENYKEIAKCGVGTSFNIYGEIVLTPTGRQPFEINATAVVIEGSCPPEYPLQKKRHTVEFLRTLPHLRARTNTFSAVFRLRSVAAFAIHKYFNDNGFVAAHTPLITGSDCEGAGEMFRVTTLDMENIPRSEDGQVDYSRDFFSRATNLTVSGQLEAEGMALSFGKVYTFGPTFRAENSNTPRHAAEFWMVEPEIAFADLVDDMNMAEDMIKFVVDYVLEHCPDELAFFNQFYDKTLIERLTALIDSEFIRISYTQAVEILKEHNDKFDYKVEWGADLQTEHERFLTEEIYKKPVFVTDYPKEIKSFYMRLNDDGKTVAATDMLVPGVGELIGGSQREERLEILEQRMIELGIDTEEYNWYLDLRRFGTAKHAGFGLGFERLVMYLTGVPNIRDVLLYPRTPGNF